MKGKVKGDEARSLEVGVTCFDPVHLKQCCHQGVNPRDHCLHDWPDVEEEEQWRDGEEEEEEEGEKKAKANKTEVRGQDKTSEKERSRRIGRSGKEVHEEKRGK